MPSIQLHILVNKNELTAKLVFAHSGDVWSCNLLGNIGETSVSRIHIMERFFIGYLFSLFVGTAFRFLIKQHNYSAANLGISVCQNFFRIRVGNDRLCKYI